MVSAFALHAYDFKILIGAFPGHVQETVRAGDLNARQEQYTVNHPSYTQNGKILVE